MTGLSTWLFTLGLVLVMGLIYGAGMTGAELSHQETKDMAPLGGSRLAAILKRMFADGFE